MGIRQKISLGFASLAVLLLFAGMVSFFELSRLEKSTQSVLDASVKNMTLTTSLLNALQEQNSALLRLVIADNRTDDSLFKAQGKVFDRTLAEATVTVRDRIELDSVYAARTAFQLMTASYFDGRNGGQQWLAEEYQPVYIELAQTIKNYMNSSQNSLVVRASMLENNAYRAITPTLITVLVMLMLVLVFFYMTDLYYIRPTLGINNGLKTYLALKVPFTVKGECSGELLELKENIEKLISMYKNKRTE